MRKFKAEEAERFLLNLENCSLMVYFPEEHPEMQEEARLAWGIDSDWIKVTIPTTRFEECIIRAAEEVRRIFPEKANVPCDGATSTEDKPKHLQLHTNTTGN